LLLGLLAFFALGGGAVLPPGRIGWLGSGDLAQSYLGWAFFRASAWTWPLGADPAYGLGFHSSVYYADSIPLLAILFKLGGPLLPADFQYFGLWVLACFLLQGWFAWKLLGLASRDPAFRSAGTVFFLLAPAMLLRLGGHMALVGHWLLLAALYLCLRPARRRQGACWAALVAAAMGVHAYLFVMVAILWGADLAGRWLEARSAGDAAPLRRRFCAEIGAVVLAAALVGWQCGFFMVSGRGMQTTGFGYYKMNLLAPFDGDGWSALGLALPTAPGEYEGFNYFGAGLLSLLAVAVVLLAAKRQVRPCRHARAVSLALAMLGLGLLSLTFRIGVGAWQWEWPLPGGLRERLTHLSLQSTGRLFWPVAYLIWLGAMAAVSRGLPRHWSRIVLAAALALQAYDLWPGLMHTRAIDLARAEASPPASLASPFWEQAAGHYSVLRRVPATVAGPGWEALAFLAQRHGMATDAVQVARIDWKTLQAVRLQQQRRLADGEPDGDTLYVLDDEAVAGLAFAGLKRPQDALFRLDGRYVLAPGWNAPLPQGATDLRAGGASLAEVYRLPFHGGGGERAVTALLADGWRHAGDGGRPEFGSSGASLYLPLGEGSGGPWQARLSLACSVPPDGMRATLDGREAGEVTADGAGRCRLDLHGPASGGAHFGLLVLRPARGKVQRAAGKARFGLVALDVVAAAAP
jgi:hypothetical protein